MFIRMLRIPISILLWAAVLGLFPLTAKGVAGQEKSEKPLRIGTVAPLYEDSARTVDAVRKWITAAKAEGCYVVALPQECVLLPEAGEPIPGPTSRAIADAAKKEHIFVVANLRERSGDQIYLTSFLVSPQGEIICKYRKTHGYSWERDKIALGDDLPVFDTPLGKVAFLVGSDIDFPETAMVYSWLGARLVFWATEPEPVRDVYRYEQILRIRAMDELLTIVASDYAGKTSWYSYSVPGGRVGLPIGRSCVVTPAGEFAADTSYQSGLAVATVRIPAHIKKPLYLYPRSGSYLRQYDCRILIEPVHVPKLPEFKKRKARIILYPGGPADKALKAMVEKAGPDLVLLPEYGGDGWLEGTPAFEQRNLPALNALARDHHCYVVAGGIQGETWSMTYVFDRQGEILGKYAQTTFGLGHGIRVFDTDFCRLGIVVCNDLMFPEIARAEFVMGAELILCPSQFACPSGMHNHRILAARAIDNAAYCAVVLPCNRDPWQRVSIVDPYGVYTVQGAYDSPGVPVVADLDFSKGVACYVPHGRIPMGDAEGKVAKAFLPEIRTNLREEIFTSRRPELYRSLLNPAGVNPIYAPGRGPARLPSGTNLALKKPYTCDPRPNYKASNGNKLYHRLYDHADVNDLTDGVLASGELGDDRWVVWTRQAKWAAEPSSNLDDMREASVTVDLGEVRQIGSVAVHFWSAPAWASPFPTVAVALSLDGRKFVPAASTTAAAQGYSEPSGWPRVDWFVLGQIDRSARYVRLTFVFGPNAAHLAADEIAVYGQ
jgi:predicted amidohydrolase